MNDLTAKEQKALRTAQQDSRGAWHDLGFMRYKNPFGDARRL